MATLVVATSFVSNVLTDTLEYTAVPTYASTTLYTPQDEEIVKEVDKVASNCYLFVKSQIPNFPFTWQLEPNSIYPVVGGVIILNYNGLLHYVVVKAVTAEGTIVDHTNFGKPGYYTNLFTWEYLEAREAKYWRT